MSSPGYPNSLPVHAIMERLSQACAAPFHEFWADDISLPDNTVVEPTRIFGQKQLTELYLLALAVHHRGRLVTVGDAIPLEAVRGFQKRSPVVL